MVLVLRPLLTWGKQHMENVDMRPEPDIRTWVEATGGMSLSEVARRSGVSKSHLSLVFRGLRRPSIGVCRRLSQSMGVPLAEVIRLLPDSESEPSVV
jgi:DNA-binding phage protein